MGAKNLKLSTTVQFWAVSGCTWWVGVLLGCCNPCCGNIGGWGLRSWLLWWEGVLTHLAPYILPLFLLPSYSSPLTHKPSLGPMNGSGSGLKASHSVLIKLEPSKHDNLSHLVEFQTPTIFDHDHDFDCSTFYKHSEIVKIFICTLYIHDNVTTFLI